MVVNLRIHIHFLCQKLVKFKPKKGAKKSKRGQEPSTSAMPNMLKHRPTIMIVTYISLIRHQRMRFWLNMIEHNIMCLLIVAFLASNSTSSTVESTWSASLFDLPVVRTSWIYSTLPSA